MSWEFKTVEVARRYNNRAREYRWETGTIGAPIAGWDAILDSQAGSGWELISVCVDGYQENNTNMEATGYRLFFKRSLR